MITLGIPTIKRFDCLERCIDTAMEGRVTPDQILIIDNSEEGIDEIEIDGVITTIVRPYRNLGVAASWNTIMAMTRGITIISNDDVEFEVDTIELLVRAYHEFPEHDFFFPTVNPENSYSLFIARKRLWMTIGPFDEQFYPAYFEDNDWDERRMRAGKTRYEVPNCTYRHIGSATKQSYTNAEMDRHHMLFRENRERFRRKWGDEPGGKLYEKEYNGNYSQFYT